jgi:type I restriction enzyme, S subunit
VKANWKTKPLREFVEAISTGPFGSLLHKSDYVSKGVPLVNPMNIIAGQIVPDPDKLIDEATCARLGAYILRKGDVVVARRGEIGRCAVIGKNESGWVCGTGSFFIRPGPRVEPSFLANLIRSPSYKAKLEAAAGGATMLNLSNEALGALIVSMPPRDEQRRILGTLDGALAKLSDLRATYKAKLETVDELEVAFLHQAFSGNL